VKPQATTKMPLTTAQLGVARQRARAARPAALFIQYTLVTGGAGFMIQRLAEEMAGRCDVDVAAYAGPNGAVASRLKQSMCIPREALPVVALMRPYAYVDAAFPLRDHHCELIEELLAVMPDVKLGVRFHSEACFIRHYLNDRRLAILRRADVVFAHHTAMRDEISALIPGGEELPWRVIAPGVDVVTFRPGGTDVRAVREYASRFGVLQTAGGFAKAGAATPASELAKPTSGRPEAENRRYVVAMSGRASPEKNWLDYLLICRRLKDLFGDELLCLSVTGPQRGWRDRSHLDEIARFDADLGAPARITGFLPDWQNLLAFTDVYVQTSCSESFCRTAAEAQSCGVPVVATAVGGLKHLVVEDGRTGLLVEPAAGHVWNARLTAADREAFFRRIAALLKKHDARRAMGALARRRAMEALDERSSVNEYADAIGVMAGLGD